MEKKDFYNLIKATPKAELHLHIEALISRNSIKKLYKKLNGKTMPADELKNLFSYDDLPGFLDSFIYIQNLYKDIEDLDWIFEDLKNYMKKNNIVYCEAFFSPTAHLKKGISFSQLSDCISNNSKKINSDPDIETRYIIDVSRTYGESNAMQNLNNILEQKNPYIIGIGLGGDEKKGPAKTFRKVFEKAVDNNLHVVAHAGEVCDSSSIKETIEQLHAERIGHGLTAAYDQQVIKMLKDGNIPLEVCPTSNVFTNKFVHKITEHPVKKLYDQGVTITINTDDPTFFKVSLIDEFWNLYSKLNFSLQDIEQIILNGFKSSFLPENKKKKYCKDVRQAWNQWFENNPQCPRE